MSVELVMPKTGLTNTENTLDSWSVSEGDKISKGQQIAEIESEKTTMPFESHEDGIIHLIAKSGETIAVGGVIALLAADKTEYDSICAETTVQEINVKKETTTSTDNIANSIELVMPKTGLTNTENTLDSWTVAEGDTISKGQQVAEIESEKTTMPFESHEEGIIHLIAKAGETIAVGGVIALLAPTKDDYEKICAAGNSAISSINSVESGTENKEESKVQAATNVAVISSGIRVKASPLAKKRAKERGVDLQLIVGTGPNGRIVAKDVDNYVPETSALKGDTFVNEHVHIPLTPIRKAIAKNMFNSLRTMAQTSDSVEVDVTELMQLRKKLVDNQELLGTKITINDLLSYAAVKTVKRHPLANASFAETEIIEYPYINLSMAVATDYGLTSPVVKNADGMSLTELSLALRDITVRARERKLTPDDQRDGTFTITNMGIFPVDNFNPILPAPQSCIMGFGRCTEKPAVYKGEICIRTMMVLSVTYDHRVFDGGEIGKIMKDMKEYLENPVLFLAQ